MKRCLWLGLFLAGSIAQADGTASTNIVPDSSFEQIREVVIASDKPIFNAIQAGTDFGQEDSPIVTLPFMDDETGGFIRLKVINGAAGNEVHTGERAVLLNGSWSLRKAVGQARAGDVFKAGIYAKGKGKIRVILHLLDATGKPFAQVVPPPVVLDTNQWTLVEQTLDTRKTAGQLPDKNIVLDRVFPRLETQGDIVIDDFTLIREDK